GAELGGVETYRLDERYPTFGVHSTAVNRCNGARVAVRHPKSRVAYTIEARAYNDGVAFRTILPGEQGREPVPDEATTSGLVGGSTVWYHTPRGHYEGVYAPKPAAEVKAGECAAPPLTFKLPGGRGYAAITEASLGGFAGMALQAAGPLEFAV